MHAKSWPLLEMRRSRIPWQELRRVFIEEVARDFGLWISSAQPHFRDQLLVAAGRFDHGVRLVCDFTVPVANETRRVLDIGSGNGGVALAFANDPANDVYSIDIVPNVQASALRSRIAVPFRQIVADGADLPIDANSIDLVLLIDVLEHLPQPGAVGAEIMRVLRPGGRCIVLTPSRVPLLLRRDPHYGIPGLVWFPNGIQRWIVNRLFRRRITIPSGQSLDAYDVEHIYWSVDEVIGLFPGAKTIDVLYETAFRPPPGTFHWRWIRHPRRAYEKLRYTLRRFLFGAIIIHKEFAAADAPVHDRLTVA